MGYHRVLAFAAVLAAITAHQAAAQSPYEMGMPPGMYPPGMGMPGGPMMPGGMPGMGPASPGPGFGGPPAGPPPACQQLMADREGYMKNGAAIQAKKGKADPPEACKLFKAFLASEAKMLQTLEQHQQECGVPTDIVKHIRDEKAQVTKLTGQICDAAAQGPRNVGPSLSDALNSTPTLPEASSSGPNHGTYDTLTGGNALVR
jgi:hypothetical protein